MEKFARIRNIKLISIGNSKGVRLPKPLLQKYGISETLFLEETERGILLYKNEESKLSWEETYKATAQEQEYWEDFDQALLDGLEGEEFDTEAI